MFFSKGDKLETSQKGPEWTGSWWNVTVKDVSARGTKYLIEFDDLLEDDDADQHVQEWVKADRLRYRTPDDSKSRSVSTRNVNDFVDMFERDGWWEGIVYETHDDKISIYFPSTEELYHDITDNDKYDRRVRSGFEWDKTSWQLVPRKRKKNWPYFDMNRLDFRSNKAKSSKSPAKKPAAAPKKKKKEPSAEPSAAPATDNETSRPSSAQKKPKSTCYPGLPDDHNMVGLKHLMEHGFLTPGDVIFFGRHPDIAAGTVLASGKVQVGNFTSSNSSYKAVHDYRKHVAPDLKNTQHKSWWHEIYAKLDKDGGVRKLSVLRSALYDGKDLPPALNEGDYKLPKELPEESESMSEDESDDVPLIEKIQSPAAVPAVAAPAPPPAASKDEESVEEQPQPQPLPSAPAVSPTGKRKRDAELLAENFFSSSDEEEDEQQPKQPIPRRVAIESDAEENETLANRLKRKTAELNSPRGPPPKKPALAAPLPPPAAPLSGASGSFAEGVKKKAKKQVSNLIKDLDGGGSSSAEDDVAISPMKLLKPIVTTTTAKPKPAPSPKAAAAAADDVTPRGRKQLPSFFDQACARRLLEEQAKAQKAAKSSAAAPSKPSGALRKEDGPKKALKKVTVAPPPPPAAIGKAPAVKRAGSGFVIPKSSTAAQRPQPSNALAKTTKTTTAIAKKPLQVPKKPLQSKVAASAAYRSSYCVCLDNIPQWIVDTHALHTALQDAGIENIIKVEMPLIRLEHGYSHPGYAVLKFITEEALRKAEPLLEQLYVQSCASEIPRPLIPRRPWLTRDYPWGKKALLPGHLNIDQEMTAHFAQPNSIEFEMALDWRVNEKLLEKARNKLYTDQAAELSAVMQTYMRETGRPVPSLNVSALESPATAYGRSASSSFLFLKAVNTASHRPDIKVQDAFAQFGWPQVVTVNKDKVTGHYDGTALVQMESPERADMVAQNMKEMIFLLGGSPRPLSVEVARAGGPRGSQSVYDRAVRAVFGKHDEVAPVAGKIHFVKCPVEPSVSAPMEQRAAACLRALMKTFQVETDAAREEAKRQRNELASKQKSYYIEECDKLMRLKKLNDSRVFDTMAEKYGLRFRKYNHTGAAPLRTT